MHTPILLLINGPAGIGKSTIAKRYIDDHPLALLISADDLIASMGLWLSNEAEGRQLAFRLLLVMAAEHLRSGHTVVIPHLLTKHEEADALQAVASQQGVPFIECTLVAPKQEAIQRLFDRGTWGEPDAPPLADADTPIAEGLYDKMEATLRDRSNSVPIRSVKDDIDGTYQNLRALVDEAIAKNT
ncbi:MAG TPA: AAA family ATPase [Candidatus Saccharimonadales bacterium]